MFFLIFTYIVLLYFTALNHAFTMISSEKSFFSQALRHILLKTSYFPHSHPISKPLYFPIPDPPTPSTLLSLPVLTGLRPGGPAPLRCRRVRGARGFQQGGARRAHGRTRRYFSFNEAVWSVLLIQFNSSFNSSFYSSFNYSLNSSFNTAFNSLFNPSFYSSFNYSLYPSSNTSFNSSFNSSFHYLFNSTFNSSINSSFNSLFSSLLNSLLNSSFFS